MNKSDARIVSQSGITCGQIKRMLVLAYDSGAANEQRSKLNASFTKAVAYNIFWKAYRDKIDDAPIRPNVVGEWYGARNALVEFGEFWDGWIPDKKPKRKLPAMHHQDPIDPHIP